MSDIRTLREREWATKKKWKKRKITMRINEEDDIDAKKV
jgi:hypothetical protein